MRTCASRSESNCQPLRSSSRRRLLNDSIQAFCHGEPGSMNRVDTGLGAPVRDRVRDELWAIVEPHKRRGLAPLDRQAGKRGGHAFGVDVVIDDDRQTLSGVLVDDVQQLDLLAVDRS